MRIAMQKLVSRRTKPRLFATPAVRPQNKTIAYKGYGDKSDVENKNKIKPTRRKRIDHLYMRANREDKSIVYNVPVDEMYGVLPIWLAMAGCDYAASCASTSSARRRGAAF